jgi:hypothetical protein
MIRYLYSTHRKHMTQADRKLLNDPVVEAMIDDGLIEYCEGGENCHCQELYEYDEYDEYDRSVLNT